MVGAGVGWGRQRPGYLIAGPQGALAPTTSERCQWHRTGRLLGKTSWDLCAMECFLVPCLGLTLYPVFLHLLHFSDRLPQVISELLPVLRIGSVEVY